MCILYSILVIVGTSAAAAAAAAAVVGIGRVVEDGAFTVLVGSSHHRHHCLLSTMICVRAVQVEPVAGVVPVCKGRD